MEIQFIVKKVTRSRKVDEEKFSVSLKSEDGHSLKIVSKSSTILNGFAPGEVIEAKVYNPQKRLEESNE
jgi:hypothetical protein